MKAAIQGVGEGLRRLPKNGEHLVGLLSRHLSV
jgi:hypothetical protein